DVGSGSSQQASLNPLQTTTTQVAETEVSTTTTSVPVSTSTTNVVGGSEVLPDVPQANVLFAPPTANGSGDPLSPLDPGAELATVESIADGDTIDVRFGDGSIDTVRLIGINSPESGECFSEEASLILSILAPVGSQIGMTIDQTDRDIYGRLLRYVWVETMSINEELVRRGASIAREYPPDTALAARLDDAQTEARQNLLGLWATSACGPSAGTEITIVRIEADAAGDDNENLNEEYVRLRNSGYLAVDMTGWVLKDASASHRYTFPAGFVFASGLEVRIYTGCGADTQNSLYWCSGGAIWNNDGDTAFVLDQNGNTVVYQDYVPATTTTSSTTSTTTPATTAPPPSSNCHPSYQGACVPVGVSDVDCKGGSGDGPYYVGRVTVIGYDEYGLDHDKDGIGCENS
ncbi:MAG: lamin tail domain-containing protein, partial [Acidimicrobiia bacterium]